MKLPIILTVTLMCTGILSYGKDSSEALAAKAFKKGSALLSEGNAQGALSLLATAVDIEPDNTEYQLQLALAYSATGKHGKKWVHLRQAVRVGENNPQAEKEFMKMWGVFDRSALLNVGQPVEAVREMLGKPDSENPQKNDTQLVYGFMRIDFSHNQLLRCIDLRGMTNEILNPPEQLKVSMDLKRWEVGYHYITRTEDHMEATPKGEKVQNWTEMFSKQRFPFLATGSLSPRQMMDHLRDSMSESNPNVFWEILRESDDSVLYHWRIQGDEQQHEVACILSGKRDMYRVAYVKKTDKLSVDELGRWKTAFTKALFVPSKATN